MATKTKVIDVSCGFIFILSVIIFSRPFISGLAYPLIGRYISLSLIVMLFFHLLYNKNLYVISRNPFSLSLLLYIISIVVSLFYTINLRSSLHQIYQQMPLLCIFFIASNLKNNESAKLIRAVIISALVLSIYGIYQYLWGLEYTKEYLDLYSKEMLQSRYVREILFTKRAMSLFFSPNMFASFLIMAIPITAGILFDKITRKKHYLFYGFSLLIMLIALLFTKSLAGWISLSFGLIIFFVLAKRVPRKIVLILALTILLIPFLLVLSRYNMFLNLANQQNTVLQRLSFLKTTTCIIKDFPLGGVGFGNFGNIYPKYRAILGNETRFAHNLFLQTWSETGLLGFAAMLLLIFSFMRLSFKIEKNFITIGLLTACYVFIINNLLDISYFIPQVSYLWWIALGLLSQKITPQNNKIESWIKTILILALLALTYLSTRSLMALDSFRKSEYKRAIYFEPYNDLYHLSMKNFDKAIELNPYSPFYHKALAQYYLKNGMVDNAISEFEKASQLYPANEWLHQKLFDLYTKIGEPKKAEKEGVMLKEFYSKYSGYFIR